MREEEKGSRERGWRKRGKRKIYYMHNVLPLETHFPGEEGV